RLLDWRVRWDEVNAGLACLAFPVLLQFFTRDLRCFSLARVQRDGLLVGAAGGLTVQSHCGKLSIHVLGALREAVNLLAKDVRQLKALTFIANGVPRFLKFTG